MNVRWLTHCQLYIIILVVCGSRARAQQIRCPGDPVSISCSRTPVLIWQGSALNGQCNGNNILLEASSLTVENISDTFVCGDFTATLTNLTSTSIGQSTFVTLVSSLAVTATPSLDGTTITCSNGASDVENVQLTVPVPTPDELVPMSFEQVSLSEVRVTLMITGDIQCVSEYAVEAFAVGGSSQTSGTSSDTTVSVSGLELCRYSYDFVAFTQTSSGSQSTRNMPFVFTGNVSGLNGVNNVMPTRFNLEWDQISNGDMSQNCITHYYITSSSTGYNTTGAITSVPQQVLIGSGFPSCQSIAVNVKPYTMVGPVLGGVGNASIVLHPAEFVDPNISAFFFLQNQALSLNFSVQDDIDVPTRMYGYSRAAVDCTPNTTFTGSSEMFSVSGGEAGDDFTICVRFQKDDCMTMGSADFTVPDTTISNIRDQVSGTSYTLTVTLPVTPYRPDELEIISSINPPDVEPIRASFPTSLEYTVTFSNLRVGTSYTYTIMIILKSNPAIIVVNPATGSFILPSCGRACIAGSAVGALVVLLAVCIVAVIIIVCAIKYRDKDSVSKSEDVKPDPNTEGNVAYGHVQPRLNRAGISRRGTGQSSSQPPTELEQVGPIYEEPEDFKPDPNTEGNVAYGHVQPRHHRH